MSAELSENNWVFLDTGESTGKFNMEYDLELVNKCAQTDKSFFRLYRWKPYCISLGFNQHKSGREYELDYDKCKNDGIDIVTRPTGGRSVFHSEEITYSVVLKTKLSVHQLHKEISCALISGIQLIEPENYKLKKISFNNRMPDLFKLIKTGMYNFCFNTSVRYEVNYLGKKLIGSAQRKFGDVVLQHGSVLLGGHHKNIVDYFKLTNEARKIMRNELHFKTISLGEILQREVSYDEAADSLKTGFIQYFKLNEKKVIRKNEAVLV